MVPALIRLAIVVAAASACAACENFHSDRYLPSAPDTVNALSLTVAPASIPADGFSTTTVTAQISAGADADKRVIKFTTTTGTIVGASGNGTEIERTVDTSGAATIELRSSRTVESATVTASVKEVATVSTSRVVTFVAVPAADIIRLSSSASSAPADGATITALTAQIAVALPAGRRSVTFTSSLGTFVADPTAPTNDDLNRKTFSTDADGTGRAVAYLRSRKTELGQAIVTAKVDEPPSVSTSISLDFVRAHPERMLLTTNSPTVTASFTATGIVVTATLIRAIGTPTTGAIVRFRATDSAGADRSFFTSITRSDEAGVVTATFSPGTGAALGPLVITATVDGTSVSAQTTVVVVAP